MLVVNGFDLWQRDTFFSAAEEVQRSADIMESAYRTWERQKIEGLKPIYLDELCRELQTALGTAKWQLEEFGKAVSQSYRIREDDITIARHKQFIDAIENQISRVETSLQQSFNEQGKTPLRWVKLDEEESDDLAAFLSGPKKCVRKPSFDRGASSNLSTEKRNCIKVENIDSEIERSSGSTSIWSSSNRGEWKIVIDPEEDQINALEPPNNTEVTPKDKGLKPLFWRQRYRDWLEAKEATFGYSRFRRIGIINQILGRCGGCQRQLQAPIPSKLSAMKFKLLLMVTLFLIVPFLMYSA